MVQLTPETVPRWVYCPLSAGCESKWDDARTGAITGLHREKPVDWGKVVGGGEGHSGNNPREREGSKRRRRRNGFDDPSRALGGPICCESLF